jgi:hypothetical protein
MAIPYLLINLKILPLIKVVILELKIKGWTNNEKSINDKQ